MSLLPIVNACDNFRIESCTEPLYPFYIHVPPKSGEAIIGYLRTSIFAELERYNQQLISSGSTPIWEIIHSTQEGNPNNLNPSSGGAGTAGSVKTGSNESMASGTVVGFSNVLYTPEKRSEAMRIMCEKWHRDGEPFGDLISGKMWRNELYPIYTHRTFMLLNVYSADTDGGVPKRLY